VRFQARIVYGRLEIVNATLERPPVRAVPRRAHAGETPVLHALPTKKPADSRALRSGVAINGFEQYRDRLSKNTCDGQALAN
jgi:hypothetical protein